MDMPHVPNTSALAAAQATNSPHMDIDAMDITADTMQSSPDKGQTLSRLNCDANATEHDVIHKSIQNKSFIDHIKFIVELKSDTVFSTWYNDKGKAINNYTFQQLWDEAGHCAHLLRNKWSVNKGDRVVLCYDFGLHFFAIFLGCLRAGVTAVLVYPPAPPLVKSLTKMNKVIKDCSPALILTQTSINLLRAADRANPTSKSQSMWPSGVKYQVTDRIIRHDPFIINKNKSNSNSSKQAKKGFLSSVISGRSSSPPPSFDEPNIAGSDLAFLQYTSGSTGNPKGVMVTHDALRANVELVQSYWLACCAKGANEKKTTPERFVTCSWLPQYHDMGLIQMAVTPLAGAFRVHMTSPVSFIRNPLLWIDLMSQHKCHIGAAPDFAYRLVTRKFNETKEDLTHKLDLSSVLHFQNAAEPIRLDTEKGFAEAFCSHGLRKDWFLAAYGLAENVVGASYNHGSHLSTIREGEDLQPFIAIAHRGNLHSSIDIIIVDSDTRVQRPDNVTGEIWIAGASVTAGYYNQPQLTAETFQATLQGDSSSDADRKIYLRTGDYGFYQEDYLYICGRKKDIIIVNGVNYYPQDIEHAVEEASSAVRPGCVAAFSSDETGNDGQLEIVFEIRVNHADDAATVCQEIRKVVIEHIGLTPVTIAAVKERTISKTTSGKIQRRQNRQRLRDGDQKAIFNFSANPTPTAQVALDGDVKSSTKTISTRNTDQFEDSRDIDFCELVKSCIGADVKAEDTWKDIGLSSMMEIELRQSLAQRYNTSLPSNCFELFPTVVDLEIFLEASTGQALPTSLPKLKRLVTFLDEKPLAPLTSATIQFVGVLVILFMFALPIVPAYEIGKVLVNDDRAYELFFIDLSPYVWVWYPLVVPFWAITFTIEVILAKWIVIGRYREGYISQTDIYFLRWWFVDRLVHIWESFLGRFIMGTPLVVFFDYLMGANVHASSSIDTFIREFDLVDIGPDATVSEGIRCRMFGPCKDGCQGPTLRFRTIQVGASADIKGILCPGVKVGSNCQVSRTSVLVEGAQAPPNTTIRGNPGFIHSTRTHGATDADAGSNNDSLEMTTSETRPTTHSNAGNRRWIILGAMKMLWLLVELYFAFTCFLVVDILVRDELPDWRYARLLYWITSIGLTSTFFIVSSIILKWIIIGKKRPGPACQSVPSELASWACDFHYSIGGAVLYGLTFHSSIWNVILLAFGMDIDLRSHVAAHAFLPSQLDLITVKRSFVSKSTFDIKQDGQYKAIKVEDSSIGLNVVCSPGVTVSKSLVSPATYVTTNLVHDRHDPRNELVTGWELIWIVLLNTILHIIMLVMVAASFIPAFELWMNVIKPQTPLGAVPVVVACVVIQTVVWLILLRAVELVTLAGSGNRTELWCVPLYMVYQSLCYSVQVWSFVSLLWGTPMMNTVLRLQGADVQGRLLYFGFRVYETSLMIFGDGAVVDESSISGHYGTFSTITLGKCYIDGIMHQRCFTLTRSVPTTQTACPSTIEHGPGKMVGDFGPSCLKQPQEPPQLSISDGSCEELSAKAEQGGLGNTATTVSDAQAACV